MIININYLKYTNNILISMLFGFFFMKPDMSIIIITGITDLQL